MAEAYLARDARLRRIDLSVSSAGVLDGGLEVPTEVRELLGEAGDGLLERPGRQFVREDVLQSDLILCMARLHVREIVVAEPSAWPRTFTLKEIVRRGSGIGPRPPWASIEPWLTKVHEGRDKSDLLGESLADDVADPYGGSMEDYLTAGREIHQLIERLVGLLWP